MSTKTFNFPSNPKLYDWADGKKRLGAEAGASTLTITGTGFGVGPTVVLNELWGAATVGAADTTNWDAGHYLTNFYPSVFAGWGGINGVGIREGGTSAATDNRLTGFRKYFSAFDSYFVAFETCVPSGRHFSGASSPASLPTDGSNLKMDWTTDGEQGSGNADHVAFSRVNPNDWATGGNKSNPALVYGDNGFDFAGWNGFQLARISGQPDGFVDNGITEITQTTSAGTYTKIDAANPVFGGGAPTAQFTTANFPGWSGNFAQDMTQHLFSYYYRAHGANCAKRLEIADNATYSLATKRRVIKPDSWSDTEITATPESWQTSGMTHWFVVDTGTIIDSGAL